MNVKKICLAATAAGTALLLAACGSGTNDAASSASSVPAASQTAMASVAPSQDMVDSSTSPESDMPSEEASMEGHDHHHGMSHPMGLEPTMDGYTLALSSPSIPAGAPTTLDFSIMGPDGSTVTAFDPEMTKKMHVVLVRSDLTGYQHLHPEMDADGNWTLELPQMEEGTYRVVTDFVPTGAEQVVLGDSLTVGSKPSGSPKVEESRVSEVDGYRAELVGDTEHEAMAPMKVVITKGGQPVTEIDPFLGTSAHFVAFSDEDLSYVHMHPNSDTPDADGALSFTAPPMDHAMWKSFVQVKLDGEVKTFEFGFRGQ